MAGGEPICGGSSCRSARVTSLRAAGATRLPPMGETVAIVGYRESWPAEFRELARTLRAAFGDRALRIDHIGSTAVAGLPAKDVIDAQITVATLRDVPAAIDGLEARPYADDHPPPGFTGE